MSAAIYFLSMAVLLSALIVAEAIGKLARALQGRDNG